MIVDFNLEVIIILVIVKVIEVNENVLSEDINWKIKRGESKEWIYINYWKEK